jgi:exodeoxyribonuclease VII small subunit
MTTSSTDDSSLSFEDARERLQQIVSRLEAGNVPLAESMELWAKGEELARICQQWLDGARARIEAAQQATAHDEPVAGTD